MKIINNKILKYFLNGFIAGIKFALICLAVIIGMMIVLMVVFEPAIYGYKWFKIPGLLGGIGITIIIVGMTCGVAELIQTINDKK